MKISKLLLLSLFLNLGSLYAQGNTLSKNIMFALNVYNAQKAGKALAQYMEDSGSQKANGTHKLTKELKQQFAQTIQDSFIEIRLSNGTVISHDFATIRELKIEGETIAEAKVEKLDVEFDSPIEFIGKGAYIIVIYKVGNEGEEQSITFYPRWKHYNKSNKDHSELEYNICEEKNSNDLCRHICGQVIGFTTNLN